MSFTRALWPVLAALCMAAASGTAHALVVNARENPAAEVGAAVELTATAMGVGAITYTWDFGDGTRLGPMDSATIEHTFAAPGHYVIIVIAKDDSGVRSDSFVQTIHHPLTAQPPAASSTIVYDAARDHVCTVNPDHDSVSCLDGATLERRFEASVGEHPRTLALDDDGALWVTCDGSSSISIVDASGAPAETITLPYGSHPFGIVKSPTSDVMFVAASGTGQLLAISTKTRAVVDSVDVGPSATGIAVSGDGERVLVTRFISPVDHGEVTEVSASQLEVVRRFELAANPGPDTEATSRGVPNYLRSVLVTPDGRSAWVLSKQDNVARGVARDGMPLTFETTTRTVLSVLDLEQNEERLDARVDINNRSLGLAGALSPVGDYLFVALLGTNGVDVLDTFDGNSVGGRRELGAAPDGVALGANGRLYVHAFLSRSVLVLDASGVLASTDFSLPLVMQAQTVASEQLPADVLQGKQIFYNAADTRMTRDGYIACATCHLDGDSDNRVWDFTSRGEGLRNTTSLLGKRGTGQGPLHWTANFDEVQDFEHDIRNAFGGTGFMSDADFMTGTRNQTLGDEKAGVSAELDALAAYLESLDQVPASPFRDQDGTLTEDGWAGHALFETAGCRECHGGPDFTDSHAGMRHDVGTLSATSGQRLGAELDGLDTPTLRGVWQTAPYLHDGSARTLLEAIASPDDRHGRTRELSADQQAQLVSYLLQIDNTQYEDEHELPPPQPDAGSGVNETDGAVPVAGAPAGSSSSKAEGGCSIAPSSKTTAAPFCAFVFAFAFLCSRARRWRALALASCVVCLALGCRSDPSPTGAGGSAAVPSVGGAGGASGAGAIGGVGGVAGGAGSIGGMAGMNTGGMPGAGGSGGSGSGAGGIGGDGGSGLGGGGGSASGGVGGSAGSGTGGDGGSGGSSATCPLPASFSWTSSGSLAEPQSPPNHDFVSLKDFTIARVGDQYAIYATAFDSTASWTGVYIGFSDFSELGSATQTWLGNRATVAPQLMYFTPKDIWVLTYQWGFQYATSTDPSDPDSWSQGSSLLTGNPTTGHGGTGPIDQTVICDSTDCYIFFAGDNGRIYRGSMPIDDFPSAFTNTAQIMQDTTAKLFEGVEVYSIKGSDEYLMIVEAMGAGGRYFRAFTADALGAPSRRCRRPRAKTVPLRAVRTLLSRAARGRTTSVMETSFEKIPRKKSRSIPAISGCSIRVATQPSTSTTACFRTGRVFLRVLSLVAYRAQVNRSRGLRRLLVQHSMLPGTSRMSRSSFASSRCVSPNRSRTARI